MMRPVSLLHLPHHDGSPLYVSDEAPGLGEMVTVRVRTSAADPVDAVWLRTTAFGDDKDRVLIRSDGEPTYFAADIAYHRDKLGRADLMLTPLGADHHGYVPRMRAAIAALGASPDRYEAPIMQLVGVFLLFPLVNTGDIGLLFLGLAILTVGLGFTYGPQAALYSELFPASVRFSGVSISYAFGAILGGAFAPMIATALVQATGGTTAVGWYLFALTAVSLAAVSMVRDRSGIDLGIGNQAEQEVGALVFDKRSAAQPVPQGAL